MASQYPNPQQYNPQPEYHAQQGGVSQSYQGSQQPVYGNQQGGVAQPVYGNQHMPEQQQYGHQQAPMQQQYGQQGRASPKPIPRQRPPLPRSISSTSLDKTTHCRHVIRQDWVIQAPPGGTNFFSTVPAFTLTLPSLDGYPGDFQQCVFNQLIDKGTQRSLEEEKCLNWCGSATRLVPLYTTGDGNCLLHAASLAMWGFQDKEYTLRRAVHTALQNHSSNQLRRRWKYAREQENLQMGVQLEDHQWEREWEVISSQASPEILQGQPLESLEDFHIFVLANVLRRPIVMYAAPKLRSQATGSTLQQMNFHGIYLPLLWEPNSCKKDPLPLGYYGGHFVALVAIEYSQQRSRGSFTLPLTDFHGQRLPVRFALSMEDHTALVMDYLRVVGVTGHNSPYITTSNITCAALTIADRPAYVETLITGFIDACRAAHFGQQQQQQDTQPSQLHYNQLDAPPPSSQVNQPFYGNASAAKPSTGDQDMEKCINNCGMYGRPEWAGLCSQCYQKQHHTEHQEQPQQSARNGLNGPFLQPTGLEPQHQPPGDGREKCINNCGLFGDPSKGGLCSQCHQKHYQTEWGAHHQGGQVHRNIPPQGNQPSHGNIQQQPNTPAGGQKCINDCGQYADPSNGIGMCQRCFQRESQAASADEGNRGNNGQNFQQQPQQNFGGQAPSLNSGSIKCPRCSNPGHPNYLGMCETCYQRGNAGGREPSPQRKNDHIYETIPGAPEPTQDPNARTKCRTPSCEFFGTAQTANYCSQCFEKDMERILREADNPLAQPSHPPPSQLPRQPELPPQQPPEFQHVRNVEQQFPPAQLPPQVQEREPAKCPRCKNFFANEEYGGMCSSCFMEKTKAEIQEPVPKQNYPEQHFNQAPRYDPCQTRGCRNLADIGGYCKDCLHQPDPEPRQRVSTAPVGYNPRYETCANMDCNNPRTQNSYCDNCNMGGGRSYAATQNQGPVFSQQPPGPKPVAPVPKPRKRNAAQNFGKNPIAEVNSGMSGMTISGGDDQCFLCNSERGGNVLCRRHAEMTRRVMTEQHGNPVPQSRSEPQFSTHTQPLPLSTNPSHSHGGYQTPPSQGQRDSFGQFGGPQQPSASGTHAHQQPPPQSLAGGFGQGVRGHGQSAAFGTDFSGSQQPGVGNHYPQQQARHPPQSGVFGASGHRQPGQSRGSFGTDLSGYPRQDDQPPPLHPREPIAPHRTPPPQQRAAFGINMEPSPQHRTNGAQGATGGGAYVGGEKLKQLCAIPGCSFKGYRELNNLCPDCYEEKYNKSPPDHLPLV